MLLGFLAMYFRGPAPHTFDMVKLQEFASGGGFTHAFQLVAFGAVALGFAVKVPDVPFHTWLPTPIRRPRRSGPCSSPASC